MTEPFFSFPDDRTPDRSPITVRIMRPMLMLRMGEDAPRHADSGEIVTTERHVLESLALGDYEVATVC